MVIWGRYVGSTSWWRVVASLIMHVSADHVAERARARAHTLSTTVLTNAPLHTRYIRVSTTLYAGAALCRCVYVCNLYTVSRRRFVIIA